MRKLAVLVLVAWSGMPLGAGPAAVAAERPNVLIISIDDLNDWVGCLAGHPQARTPNIDRLARRGTLFANAHCQAPVCTPSRASMVSGLYPSTTGLYFLTPGLSQAPRTRDRATLVEHFARAGYRTMGAGKFHHNREAKYYQEYGGQMGGFGPRPKNKITYKMGHPLWDWGPFPERDEQMPDTRVADWVIERLGQSYDKPFLLVAGFWRPHVPMYAPQKWFDLFPAGKVRVPLVRQDDRGDLPAYGRDLTIGLPAPRHEWFLENKAWAGAVRAYLASIAFADHCAGRVLRALDESPHAKNTVVVLLSDHGFHLGEKERWAKRSLWNDSTRVPLVVVAPGHASGQVSRQPVGLIDLFPTLVELCGVARPRDLEGLSLVRLLKDPAADWDRPIRTTFGRGNHAVKGTRWKYIRYADGSEELYDHEADPHEWHNVAGEDRYAKIKQVLAATLPGKEHPVLEGFRSSGFTAFQAAEANRKERKEENKRKGR